jgi:nucleoside-diphosphate-sugar epimerase
VRALVLGGSVFVGRRLVRALSESGHDVTVLNRGRTTTVLPDGVKLLVADRTDHASMRSALEGTSWDAVFDVSGFVMAASGSDFESLLNLVDGHVGRYIYVSSIMAYDQSLVGVFPWTEDLPTNGDGVKSYGGFKSMAEAALLERYSVTRFPVTIVRPAAIYGPDNNIFDMETPMFLRLLRHLPILVPHGGLVAGSYGHVDDLCALMILLASTELGVGEVLNATTDGRTINRYVEDLAAIVGVEPNVVMVPDTLLPTITTPVFGHLFGDRHHAVLSTDKATRLTGFVPQFDLVAGHKHTYEWFCEQGWAGLESPLVDPVWRATWNFDAEAAFAGTIAKGRP